MQTAPEDPARAKGTVGPDARRLLLKRLIAQLKRHGKIGDPDASDPVVKQVHDDWRAGQIADFFALKLLAAEAAARRDTEGWLKLLRAFDPEMAQLSNEGVPVIGGIGPGALNSGRVVEIDGERRFEKIYLRKSRCFRRMSHAYSEVLEPLAPVGFAPRRQVFQGKLVAVQFGFVDGLGSASRNPEAALHAARQLGQIRMPPDTGSGGWRGHVQEYPEGMQFLRGNLMARLDRPGERISARLPLAGSLRAFAGWAISRLMSADRALVSRLPDQLDRWSLRIAGMDRVFSHGDLNHSNVASDGTLIDWDNAGWRAYGFDFAYAAAFHSGATDVDTFRALSASEVERPGREIADRFAFFYFLLHHLALLPSRRMSASTAKALVAELCRLEAKF